MCWPAPAGLPVPARPACSSASPACFICQPAPALAGHQPGTGLGGGGGRCEIISEILDTRTRNVVAESRICDYVLSNELISKTIAMVSENQSMNEVLAELFRSEGNELYIRPATDYTHPGEDLCFFEARAARQSRHAHTATQACQLSPRRHPAGRPRAPMRCRSLSAAAPLP